MRWRRVVVVLAAVGLVVAPSAGALHTAADRGRVEALRQAAWRGLDGETRSGLTGAGVVLVNEVAYDQTHPDVDHCGSMEHQHYEGVPVPRNPNPLINWHDTGVVGTICGSGQASDGLHVGVAPESRVVAHGYCTSVEPDGPSTCRHALDGWSARFNLRTYVSTSTGDPVREAVSKGLPEDADVIFVQSAGNDEGDGSTARTNTHANQTDPRYVRVAAGDGTRTGVADYSSRGDRSDPATWPHLTAPGCMWVPASVETPNRWADVVRPFVREGDCPEMTSDDATDPDSPWYRSAGWYTKGAGTSLAAPFVAGVAALMFEVHPGLAAAEAKRLLTRTADRFLATEDVDGDGEIGPEEFWDQHGYKAGYGYVDATAAVAAAHYMARHPDATVAEAVACSGTGRAEDGRLVLNPSGGPPCEASTGSEDPDGSGSLDRNGDADGEAGPSTVGDPAPGGPGEGGGQDARTLSPRTVPGSGPGAVAVLAAMGVAVLAAVGWSGRRRGR